MACLASWVNCTEFTQCNRTIRQAREKTSWTKAMRSFLYRRHATSHQRARKKHFSYFIVQRAICKLAVMHRITARKLCGISGTPVPPKKTPPRASKWLISHPYSGYSSLQQNKTSLCCKLKGLETLIFSLLGSNYSKKSYIKE